MGLLGMIKEIVERITKEAFYKDTPVVIGTGGLSRLFDNQSIFHSVDPDLVLKGIVSQFKQKLIKNE